MVLLCRTVFSTPQNILSVSYLKTLSIFITKGKTSCPLVLLCRTVFSTPQNILSVSYLRTLSIFISKGKTS